MDEQQNQLEEIKALREQVQIIASERDLYKEALVDLLTRGEQTFRDCVAVFQQQKKKMGFVE